MRFLDILWSREANSFLERNGTPQIDLKVKFSDPSVAALLLRFKKEGDVAHNPYAFFQLLNKHSDGEWARIALRCTRGPIAGAIDWHFDGNCATETIQLALNDD